MLNMEFQKKRFANHQAELYDFGIVKILDFKNPDSNEYRIRFMFEEDHYRLHISGDLGELIATNFYNMTYEKFCDFMNNPGYFEEKIDCMSRDAYVYDEDDARKTLRGIIDDHYLIETIEYEYSDVDDYLDEVLEYFDDRNGLSDKGISMLMEQGIEYEDIANIGKQRTGIIELYLLAFKLAYEQLKSFYPIKLKEI